MMAKPRRWLLAERLDGEWGFFGGRVDQNETLEQAAFRELYEESRLVPDSLEFSFVFDDGRKHFVFHGFGAGLDRPQLNKEHRSYQWFMEHEIQTTRLRLHKVVRAYFVELGLWADTKL